MRAQISAVSFIVFIVALMTIYNTTYSPAGVTPINYTTTSQSVAANGNSTSATIGSNSNVNTTKGLANSSSLATPPQVLQTCNKALSSNFFVALEEIPVCAFLSGGVAIVNAFTGGATDVPQLLTAYVAGTATAITNCVTNPKLNCLTTGWTTGSSTGINAANYASNDIWAAVTSSPANTALAIALLFIGLGLLAGLFGAGILANVVGSVGIGLAAYYYINTQVTTFGTLPWQVSLLFNGVITLAELIVIWSSIGAGGVAGK